MMLGAALKHGAGKCEGKRPVTVCPLCRGWQTTSPDEFPVWIAEVEGIRGCWCHFRLDNQINRQRNAMCPVGGECVRCSTTCGGAQRNRRGKTRLIR